MAHRINPFQVMDKCVGQRVYLVTIGDIEVKGILKGFNEYFNLVLEDVTFRTFQKDGTLKSEKNRKGCLLNGHDIAYVVPGVEKLNSWEAFPIEKKSAQENKEK